MVQRWRVLVAEPPGMAADVLRHALESDALTVAPSEVSRVDQLLEAAATAQAHVAVIGPGFPRAGLVPVIPQLLSADTRALVVSDAQLDAESAQLLLAGASGYVLFGDTSIEGIRQAVAAVASGETALHPTVVEAVLTHWRSSQSRATGNEAAAAPVGEELPGRSEAAIALSARETQILRGIVDGLTNRATAKRLGIAEKTVEAHKSRLYAKLGARNQAHATKIAHDLGLLS